MSDVDFEDVMSVMLFVIALWFYFTGLSIILFNRVPVRRGFIAVELSPRVVRIVGVAEMFAGTIIAVAGYVVQSNLKIGCGLMLVGVLIGCIAPLVGIRYV